MIHRIYSTLPTFKNLEFHPGLNVLIAEKSEGATNLQTRNRAGKTSLLEIVHFLTGANIDKKSLFKAEELNEITFGMDFDLAGELVNIKRQNKSRASFILNERALSANNWREMLGQKMFGLSDSINEGRTPTFRSMFAYFVRRAKSGAFLSPEKQAAMQGTGDHQIALIVVYPDIAHRMSRGVCMKK